MPDRFAAPKDGDVAHVSARRVVGRPIGVADEIALDRRRVARPILPRADALKAAYGQRARMGEPRGKRRIRRLAQVLAGHPDEAAARAGDRLPIAVVVVADVHPAIAVAIAAREAQRVFVGVILPDPPASGGSDDRITQHAADRRLGQRLEVECAPGRRPLGEQHPPLLVEGDLGNLGWTGGGRRHEFDDCVVAEGAVGFEPEGPNLQAIGDRIEKATVMDREAKDAPLRRGEIPGRGIAAVKLWACDIDRLPRGPGRGRQPQGRPSRQPMIVGTVIVAVDTDAMNDAGLAVRDEQRLGLRIEGEPAESRPRIRSSVGRHVGE